MYKTTKNIYKIKTSPYNDNEKLESLLNEMSEDGWDLYSMQELENDGDICYNCIFIKEVDNEPGLYEYGDGLLDFRPRIERIINPELDPYEMCLDILKKIKDKRAKITQVKSLIDGTSEDSRTVLNEDISRHINELEELKKKLSEVINPDIMKRKLGESKLTIVISEELADILDSNNDDNLLAQIVYIRQNLTESLGYIIPRIKIEIDDSLDENEFQIKVRGIGVVNSYAYCNHTMFLKKELNVERLPENTIKSKDIVSNFDTVWINDDIAKDYWIKGLSATDYITSVIEYIVIKYIDDIFDYSDINRYIEIVGNQNLYLIENIIPDFISIGELKYFLTNLIKERIPIRDIVYIFEKLNDLSDTTNKEDADIDLLSDLRVMLSRQICASVCSDNNTIRLYELSEESLEAFSINEDDDVESFSQHTSNKMEKIINKLKKRLTELSSSSESGEIILAVPMEVRHIIYLVLSQFVPKIRVIANEELVFDYNIEVLGKL